MFGNYCYWFNRMEQKITCELHGERERSFVCQHIFESLLTHKKAGFHQAVDTESKYPDAWCDQCEIIWGEVGGQWTDELEKRLGIKLLCSACYDLAKDLND
jgi:hypothetical protein